MQEKTLKKVWYGSIVLYIGTLAFAFGYNLYTKDYHSVGMAFVAVLTPCIVPLIFKLCHWNKVVRNLYFVQCFYIFCQCVGRFTECLSHLWFRQNTSFFQWMADCNSRFQSKREFTIFLIFINAVNMAVAQLWEFYEYAMLIFFKNDCINHYTQGVHDSITDMLCAAVAGICLTVFLVLYYKNGRRSFFVNIYEKFYDRNIGR